MGDPIRHKEEPGGAESPASREPVIEQSGEEYLVTMPDGTVAVALTYAQAVAMVRLRAARQRR